MNGATAYLAKNLDPAKSTCFLQHLSEGTDATARGWVLRLRIDDDHWAVNDVLCAIHSSALEPEDFQVLGKHHPRWSGPRSATTCSTARPLT